MVRPRRDEHDIHAGRRVFPHHVPRHGRAAHPRALAHRVSREATVFPHGGAVLHGHEPSRRVSISSRRGFGLLDPRSRRVAVRDVLVDEIAEIALASDETDPRAASPRRHRGGHGRGTARQRLDLGLGQAAEGKTRATKRVAADGREEIGLILARINPAEQTRDVVGVVEGPARHPGVVSRGEDVRAERRLAVPQERAEFDVSIAREVGVGRRRATLEVAEEGLEHGVPVLLHEVHLAEGDAEVRGDRAGISLVLLEGALPARLLRLVPVAHQHARHVEARRLEQPRGDGGVHATGETDRDARKRGADGRRPRHVRQHPREEVGRVEGGGEPARHLVTAARVARAVPSRRRPRERGDASAIPRRSSQGFERPPKGAAHPALTPSPGTTRQL